MKIGIGGGHGFCRRNGVVGFGIALACNVPQAALISSLWWQEVKDCNEYWHEGGHGCC